jgi:hypothetical protein
MSGLLQRLADQAVGAQASSAPRIRPAASVHAQVSVSQPYEVAVARPVPMLVSEAPPMAPQDSPPASPQRLSPQAFSKTVQPVGGDRQFAPQPEIPGPSEARAAPPRVLHEPSNGRASHEFAETAPPPLLGEAQVISAPSAITPVTPAPLPAVAMSGDARAKPTEVHVHIGRIEVIAAPEPVPKKGRTTSRNTLPLSDYLARRTRL